MSSTPNSIVNTSVINTSLGQRYQELLNDCAQKSTQLQRPPARIIAVSKTRTPLEIQALAQLGQIDFGENYVQEALPKIAALQAIHPQLIWHFIGPIQSNKAALIAAHFDWVHSIDRLAHAQRLSRQRGELHNLINKVSLRAPLNICIQVNTSGESSKSGVAPNEVIDLARALNNLPHLCLRGLMALPSPVHPENSSAEGSSVNALAQLTQEFSLMHTLLAQLRTELGASTSENVLDTLSMGMSGDWPIALAHGATHIRIGTQLFGARA